MNELNIDVERTALFEQIADDCSKCLRSSKTARQWFEKQGLDALELLKTFAIGYWDGTLYRKLADKEKVKLKEYGLIQDGRYVLRDCLVLPLKKNDRIVSIGSLNIKTNRYHIIEPREGLYLPKHGLNSRVPVIITESVIDTFMLYGVGIKNVLPLVGVNILDDHIEYLQKMSFVKVCLCFTKDDESLKVAHAIKQALSANGIDAEIIETPESISDMIKHKGSDVVKEWFIEKTNDDAKEPEISEDDECIFIKLDEREYRIMGLQTVGMDRMRVNIKVTDTTDRMLFFIDTIDLLAHRWRSNFALQVSKAIGADRKQVTNDLNTVITICEEIRLRRKKQESGKKKVIKRVLTEEVRAEAIEYLQQPDLITKIADDIKACGLVGNRNQALLSYIGCLSRFTEKPLGVCLVSRSASGKSYLQNIVTGCIPNEHLIPLTRLTSQSLYYRSENLDRTCLSIEEADGMTDALYAIRSLLSSQKLQLHSLVMDKQEQIIKPVENVVYGNVSVIVGTTDLNRIDAETRSRFLVVYLDESKEQTKRVLAYQQKMSGIKKLEFAENRKRIYKLHQNIQRVLKPVMVVNNRVSGIRCPIELLNSRRESQKFNTLVETIALIHQYQREEKTKRIGGVTVRYIEVEQSDIDSAKELAGHSISQSLDELSPLGRELLQHINGFVNQEYSKYRKQDKDLEQWQVPFTRRELQDQSKWSRYHLRQHLSELVEAGYITPSMGSRNQRYAYRLVVDHIPEMPMIT